jgi:hypothetical protein
LYTHDIFRLEVMHRLNSRKKVSSFRVPFNAAIASGGAQTSLIEDSIMADNSYRSLVAPDSAGCVVPPLEASAANADQAAWHAS